MAYDDPVLGQVDIALYAIRSLINGLQIGCTGILGELVGAAPVRVEKRVHGLYATRYSASLTNHSGYVASFPF